MPTARIPPALAVATASLAPAANDSPAQQRLDGMNPIQRIGHQTAKGTGDMPGPLS